MQSHINALFMAPTHAEISIPHQITTAHINITRQYIYTQLQCVHVNKSVILYTTSVRHCQGRGIHRLDPLLEMADPHNGCRKDLIIIPSKLWFMTYNLPK